VIRAVLFDLDDTLFDHAGAVATGITRHRRTLPGWQRFDDTAEALRWHGLEEQHYHRYLAGELDYHGQRRVRALDFAAPYEVALTDPDAWFEGYRRHYEDAWSLLPEALPCLDALEAALPGVHFAVITNSELDAQLVKMHRTALTARIDTLVASGELGVAKPDPRIFLAGCARLGVRPGEAVYVGDRLRTDAVGAASAGLTGVWLDRHRTATDEDRALAAASSALVIESLDELAPLLVGLPASAVE
jgi:putative hydrolase of the HAD superfamily